MILKSILLPLILLQLSCTSQPLLSDLSMGMKEVQWKVKDAASLYPWKIGDTIINVGLYLNGDGLKEGSLRTISLDLSSREGILQVNKDYAVDSLMESEKEDIYISTVCSKPRFDFVFNYLKSRLGIIDSVVYETIGKGDITNYINSLTDNPGDRYLLRREWTKNKQIDSVSRLGGVDTIQVKYCFHDTNSLVLLKRTFLHAPSLQIPFEYFKNVQLHLVSKNYEQDLTLLLQKRNKNLAPSNFVTIYSEANVESKYEVDKKDGFYILTSVFPQSLNYTEDKRSISEIKGRAIIYDQFGDSIYNCRNLLIHLIEPLQSFTTPGLNYLLGVPLTYIGTETQSFHYVNLQKPDVPSSLKIAIIKNKKVKAKFIPEAILFTDGTVLK